MPRRPQTLIYVGIRNSVIALDAETGDEVWRADLGSSGFVTVYFDGETLVAGNSGEVFRLDPQNGSLLWHNKLKGLGRGVVTFASNRQPTVSAPSVVPSIKKKMDDDAAAAAAAAG